MTCLTLPSMFRRTSCGRARGTLAAMSLCAFALGCGSERAPSMDTLSTEEQGRIEREIRQTFEQYVEAVKSKDLASILSFWSNSEDFVHAADGRIFGGYREWSTWLRNNEVDEWLYWNNTEIHVVVLARNAASCTVNFEYAWISDGETQEVQGSWTYVFRKSESGWQVVHSNGTQIGWTYDE